MDAQAASLTVASAAEACRDPALWGAVATHAAGALDGDGAAIVFFGADDAIVRACPRTDPDLHRRYDAELHARNHLWAAAARLPAGRAASEAMLGGREAYLRSGIFNEFIRPQAMDGLMLLTLTPPGARTVGILTVGRRRGRDLFSRDEIAHAQVLADALARTIAVLPWRQARDAGEDGVEFLVTPDGRLLSRPPGLDALLRAGALSLAGGRLAVPALPGFAAAVLTAVGSPSAWPPAVGVTFSPVRATSELSLRISILPGGPSGRGAARIRVEPMAGADPVAILARRYGLTPRETELAVHLGDGLTLPEIADALDIRLTTARTHLTRIFDKTGTRTQLALALLAARELERRR